MVKRALGIPGIKTSALAHLVERTATALDAAAKRGQLQTTSPMVLSHYFKGAAFKNTETGKVIDSGRVHDLSLLPEGARVGKNTPWQSGFVNHQGEFFTREQAYEKVHGTTEGELHAPEIYEGTSLEARKPGEPKTLKEEFAAQREEALSAKAKEQRDITHKARAEQAVERNILRSAEEEEASSFKTEVTGAPGKEGIISGSLRKLFETVMPFAYGRTESGMTKLENWYRNEGPRIMQRLAPDKSTRAYILSGLVDKFRVPVEFRDFINTNVQARAGEHPATFAISMHGLEPEVQRRVLQYFDTGVADTAGLTKRQIETMEKTKDWAEELLDRAKAYRVIPDSLKDAKLSDFIQWLNDETKKEARFAHRVKSSRIFERPYGDYQRNVDILEVAKNGEYHRAYMRAPDGTVDEVYVPANRTEAALKKAHDAEFQVEGDTLWRSYSLAASNRTGTMWRPYSYAEALRGRGTENAIASLTYTLHNLSHDVEVARLASEFLSTQQEAKENSLVFEDRDALEAELGSAEAIIDKPDDTPRSHKMARTPGYWVRMPKGYGALSDTYVPATVYSALEDSRRNESFLPNFKRLMRFWKINKTGLSPSTHFNNVMSSFFMAYMNDVPTSTIREAFKHAYDAFQHDVSKGAKGVESALWKEFVSSGAMLSSYKASEVALDITRKMSELDFPDTAQGTFKFMHKLERLKAYQLGKLATDKTKAGIDLAAELYSMEDNVFRLAAYMEAVRREMARPNGLRGVKLQRHAGRFAAEAMVDYSIDARYINALRQSILPFLAWPYRMVPMLLKTAAFKPWKIVPMFAALHAINALGYMVSGGDPGEEEKAKADWQRGELYFGLGPPKLLRMPFNFSGKPTYFNISNFLPLGDFLDSSGPGFMGIAKWPQTLTPSGPLLVAVEAAFGFDSFTGRQLWNETNTSPQNFGASLEHLWQGYAPNLPLPYTRRGGKLYDIARGKDTITGGEIDALSSILSMVGPKIDAIDQTEARGKQAIRILAMRDEYQKAIRKLYRNENRYDTPDLEKVAEQRDQLIRDYLQKMKDIRGEE